jgi:hypothetical protein
MAVLGIAMLAAAGCSSTQEKSAKLARAAKNRPAEHGIVVTKANPDVKILSTHVVHDQYGTAAVVEVKSRARKPQGDLPISIVVTGAGGKREFANDGAGLDKTLNHVPLLQPGERAFWVNDQVLSNAPKAVEAKVGPPATPVRGAPPKLVAGKLTLEQDPDGAYTQGRLSNASTVAQRRLVVYAVARKGGKVIAAGRAGIESLPAHKSRVFKVFWIGDPAGAQVSVFAPPTVLEEDGS